MEGIEHREVNPDERPVVSVIIVNWNSWKVLEPCLRSLECAGVDMEQDGSHSSLTTRHRTARLGRLSRHSLA